MAQPLRPQRLAAPVVLSKGDSAPHDQGSDELTFVSSEPATAITIDPKLDEDTPTAFSVQNKAAAKSYQPQVRLGELGLVSSAGNPIPTADALVLEGLGKVLAPGDTAHLVLSWKKGTSVRPGTYDGVLVLSAEGRDLKRRAIQVIIQDISGTVQPLISKLNIRAYRLFPLIGEFRTLPAGFAPVIPLRMQVDEHRTGLTRQPLLAALARDPAGTARVVWDRKAASLRGDNPTLGLSIDSIPFTGKYDGALNFGNDKTAVQLTVNATDLVVYPLAVLLIAVWVSIAGKNYLGGGRQVLRWKANLVAAQDAMKQAQQKFAQLVTGPAATYSIQNDFDAQSNTVWNDISLLRGNMTGALDPSSKAYQFVDTQISILSGVSSAWVLFGKQLQVLAAAKTNLPAIRPPTESTTHLRSAYKPVYCWPGKHC